MARHVVSLLLTTLPAQPVVLDNACGTGALTEEVLQAVPAAHVHAVDRSAGMTSIVRASIDAKGWRDNVEIAVMDGQSLAFDNGSFDFSVTLFGIFFFSDPVHGAAEIYRTLKVGGMAVVTAWKVVGIFPIFYAVQDKINPAAPVRSMPVFEKWMRKETVESVMRRGGFANVKVVEKEVTLTGKSKTELVEGLADNMEGIVGNEWSDEEKSKLRGATERLLEERGGDFCVESPGEEGVRMVAWIALCRK